MSQEMEMRSSGEEPLDAATDANGASDGAKWLEMVINNWLLSASVLLKIRELMSSVEENEPSLVPVERLLITIRISELAIDFHANPYVFRNQRFNPRRRSPLYSVVSFDAVVTSMNSILGDIGTVEILSRGQFPESEAVFPNHENAALELLTGVHNDLKYMRETLLEIWRIAKSQEHLVVADPTMNTIRAPQLLIQPSAPEDIGGRYPGVSMVQQPVWTCPDQSRDSSNRLYTQSLLSACERMANSGAWGHETKAFPPPLIVKLPSELPFEGTTVASLEAATKNHIQSAFNRIAEVVRSFEAQLRSNPVKLDGLLKGSYLADFAIRGAPSKFQISSISQPLSDYLRAEEKCVAACAQMLKHPSSIEDFSKTSVMRAFSRTGYGKKRPRIAVAQDWESIDKDAVDQSVWETHEAVDAVVATIYNEKFGIVPKGMDEAIAHGGNADMSGLFPPVKGVYYVKYNAMWFAEWHDLEKQRHRSRFSVTKFGHAVARAAAIAIRAEADIMKSRIQRGIVNPDGSTKKEHGELRQLIDVQKFQPVYVPVKKKSISKKRKKESPNSKSSKSAAKCNVPSGSRKQTSKKSKIK